MEKQIVIQVFDTPEKFQETMDTILSQVLELLKNLSSLEKEIFERNEKLDEEKEKAGIPTSQVAPGFKELWTEYFERYQVIVTPFCTERLLKRGFASSFGKPGKYDYVNDKCKIICTMKSAKRATIETFYHKGTGQRDLFVIKNIDDEWKIDEVKYSFSSQTNWHVSRI